MGVHAKQERAKQDLGIILWGMEARLNRLDRRILVVAVGLLITQISLLALIWMRAR